MHRGIAAQLAQACIDLCSFPSRCRRCGQPRAGHAAQQARQRMGELAPEDVARLHSLPFGVPLPTSSLHSQPAVPITACLHRGLAIGNSLTTPHCPQVHTSLANGECVRCHGGILSTLTQPPLPARLFQLAFQVGVAILIALFVNRLSEPGLQACPLASSSWPSGRLTAELLRA